MKKLKYIYLIVLMMAVSCTDQSTFNNPAIFELENGSMVRFKSLPPTDFGSVEDFNITGTLEDVNGNTSSYTLNLTATISGDIISAENILTVTSFPSEINLTASDFASALGIEVADINMGDFFQFYATTTRNDGTVFHGTDPDYGNDKDNTNLGYTESNLNLNASYKSAMDFNAILACPLGTGNFVGEYKITGDFSDNSVGAPWALPLEVEVVETSVYQRMFEVMYLADLGQPPMEFVIDFICGKVTSGAYNYSSLACSAGIYAHSATPVDYDVNDDSVFTVTFNDNILGDCGVPGVEQTITLTKIIED